MGEIVNNIYGAHTPQKQFLDLPSLAHGSSSPLFSSPSSVQYPSASSVEGIIPSQLPSSPPEPLIRPSLDLRGHHVPGFDLASSPRLESPRLPRKRRTLTKKTTKRQLHQQKQRRSMVVPPPSRPSSADFEKACAHQLTLLSAQRATAPPTPELSPAHDKTYFARRFSFVIDNSGRAAISQEHKPPIKSGQLNAHYIANLLGEDSDSDSPQSSSRPSGSDLSPPRDAGTGVCDAAAAFARALARSRLNKITPNNKYGSDFMPSQSTFFCAGANVNVTSTPRQSPATPRTPATMMNLREMSMQTPPGAVLNYEVGGTGMTPFLPPRS